MKIISLSENTSKNNNIEREHGLSLYIEACGRKIIFDFGQSDLFLKNAAKLGVDVAAADMAVISHGHYDHGGGIYHFIAINKSAPVYMRRGAQLPFYHGDRYIGLDPSIADCDRIVFTDEGITLSEEISLVTLDAPPISNDGLTVRLGEEYLPDDFDHEQYLLIEENGKRILISGCSHKGIVPIVKRFKPDVLVGGFHFMNMPTDENLMAMATELDGVGCSFYTCHCTGTDQYNFIKQYIKDINYLSSGDSMEI